MNGRFAHRRLAVLGTCLLGLLAAWWGAHDAPKRKGELSQSTEQQARHALRQRMDPTSSRAVLRLLAQAAKSAPREDLAEERPADGRPHPITQDHRRLYRDLDLLHAADLAIRDERYDEARALLAEHHRELPDLSQVEEEGLLLLADCAEQPNAANVARVQSFYDRHTSSTIRRQLRRTCLERAR